MPDAYEPTFHLPTHQPANRFRRVDRAKRRTVTMPERVSPVVRLVFSEMARSSISYDELEAASGIRRPTVKQWRRKNAPSWESLQAVLNCLGYQFLPVPAHVEILPPTVAGKLAEVAALAKVGMPEAFAAAVQIAARQLIQTAEGERIRAELRAEREARRAANDNKPRSHRRKSANATAATAA